MKILALSDRVVEHIHSPQVKELYSDVDLLISCGDLPYSYLEYVVTMLQVPAFFVHGNHDQPEYTSDGRTLHEPGGWVNLDGRTESAGPLLLAGLEGSLSYKPDTPYQYSEVEMHSKALRLAPGLMVNRLLNGRCLDILVTHAPPRNIHDGQDLPHRGFEIFLWLMRSFRPRYLLHGHQHVYSPQTARTHYQNTTVINVYPYAVIEVEE